MSISVERLESIKASLQSRVGIVIPESRLQDLRNAAEDVMTAFSMSPTTLASRIAFDPLNGDLLTRLLPQLTINETKFFRHHSQIDALRHDILPQIISTRRHVRRLCLWSAACSTGEEPYSLSILVRELLGEHHDWDVQILASDVDPMALRSAREGRFGPWSFRGVDPRLRDRYFQRDRPDLWSINRDLRSCVTFFQLNLLDDTYTHSGQQVRDIDLILCRNALIYFTREDQRSVMSRLRTAVAQDGMVMLGGTEHAVPGTDLYHPLNVRGAVVLRTTRQSHVDAIPSTPDRSHVPASRLSIVDSTSTTAGRQTASTPVSISTPAAVRQALERGDAAAAADFALRLCVAQPLSAVAHYLHGVVLREIGQFDDALIAFRRSVFLDGTLPAARIALADALQSVGHDARADRERQIALHDLQSRNSGDKLIEEPKITVAQMLALVSVEPQHSIS